MPPPQKRRARKAAGRIRSSSGPPLESAHFDEDPGPVGDVPDVRLRQADLVDAVLLTRGDRDRFLLGLVVTLSSVIDIAGFGQPFFERIAPSG
jgi:hypothetical protein